MQFEEIQKARNLTMPRTSLRRDLVKKVVVILTASRSGSSLLKSILATHPLVASLPGEEEPYYTMTGNGFPWSSDSDAFTGLNYEEEVAQRILGDMQVNVAPTVEEVAEQWRRRFVYQYGTTWPLEKLIDLLCEHRSHYDFLKGVLGSNVGLYDISKERIPFSRSFKIEEPPFVVVPPKRVIENVELHSFSLLFKTPQDCYRIGIFEKLFPKAEVRYIHLTRNFAATVNGLMDGWECNYGFFAHNMKARGTKLDIWGYSDKYKYGRGWWKFDLPPTWRDLQDEPLPNVCLGQWCEAHMAILRSNVDRYPVRYEDLCDDNIHHETVHGIYKYLGLEPCGTPTRSMHPIMATEDPEPFRWRKKRSYLEALSSNFEVCEIMDVLGYSLEPSTWR